MVVVCAPRVGGVDFGAVLEFLAVAILRSTFSLSLFHVNYSSVYNRRDLLRMMGEVEVGRGGGRGKGRRKGGGNGL